MYILNILSEFHLDTYDTLAKLTTFTIQAFDSVFFLLFQLT